MPWYPAGAKLAIDCMLGLVQAPTLMAKLHTADPPAAGNELTAANAPGYAAQELAPGAATWGSSADANSGDGDNAANILFPVNTHAADAWPATPQLGIWNGASLVASTPLNVQAPAPGARIRIPMGALDWSTPHHAGSF